MVGADTPEDWHHKGGFRIKSDGSPPIRYERDDGKYTVRIEGEVNEDDDSSSNGLEYRVGLFTEDKTLVEYPRPFEQIEDAFSQASNWMQEYSESPAEV